MESLEQRTKHFKFIYEQARRKIIVPEARAFILYQFAQQVATLAGDVAEVGVFAGGSAKIIAEAFLLQNRTIHLFDTFDAGMPPINPQKDWVKEGILKSAIKNVREFLTKYNNIKLYKGIFPETGELIKDRQFCFVHIDVDIYKSTLDCCKFFYPRVIRSGVIIFDDYGHPRAPGVTKAIDEFFRDKREYPIALPKQCFMVKL